MLSSKFPYAARYRALPRFAALGLVGLLLAERAAGQPALPSWRVARLTAAALPCLDGLPIDAVALLACRDTCAAIPWQLDERDGRGDFALPEGPQANPDDPARVIDGNDELLWMAADAGRRMRPDEEAGDARCLLEIELRSRDGPQAQPEKSEDFARDPTRVGVLSNLRKQRARRPQRHQAVTTDLGGETDRLPCRGPDPTRYGPAAARRGSALTVRCSQPRKAAISGRPASVLRYATM